MKEVAILETDQWPIYKIGIVNNETDREIYIRCDAPIVKIADDVYKEYMALKIKMLAMQTFLKLRYKQEVEK
jgi:hypothetical protein